MAGRGRISGPCGGADRVPARPDRAAGRTHVLVTSDHGEALGEHGHRTHATSLYNAETRVPFVVVGPGIQPRRIHRPVGLADLAATLLDLAGLVPPATPHMDGRSLVPLLRGEAPAGGSTSPASEASRPKSRASE